MTPPQNCTVCTAAFYSPASSIAYSPKQHSTYRCYRYLLSYSTAVAQLVKETQTITIYSFHLLENHVHTTTKSK